MASPSRDCRQLFKTNSQPVPSLYERVEESRVLVKIEKTIPVYSTFALRRRFIGRDHITEVISFTQSPGFPDNPVSYQDFHTMRAEYSQKYTRYAEEAQRNFAELQIDISAAIDFAREKFRERRGWPDSFLKKMDDVANEHLWRSTYIIVRNRSDNKIITTMRVIDSRYRKYIGQSITGWGLKYNEADNWREVHEHMPYPPEEYLKHHFGRSPFYNPPHSLPVEKYLDISAYRPMQNIVDVDRYKEGIGIVYEPGLWAIEPSYNMIGVTESLLHLLNTIFEPTSVTPALSIAAKRLYTYGDKVSVQLYRRLGFQTENERPIKRDGIEWWALAISGKDAPHLIDRLQDLKTNVTDDQVIDLRETLRTLSEHYHNRHTRP